MNDPKFRPVVTCAILHDRLLEILDGAPTSLPEIRNLRRYAGASPEELHKLDAVESDIWSQNARPAITSTQLLMARLRKTDGTSETSPAPAPTPILSHADVLAILEGHRPASMSEISSVIKRSEEFGLSTYQVEKLKARMRDAYATVVKAVNHGVYPVPVGPPISDGVMPKDESEDIVPPGYEWVGRRKPKAKK